MVRSIRIGRPHARDHRAYSALMDKWKRFERLTAALHVLRMQGAAVTWNDEINGYQIDVSVRFRFGWYDYLVVVECKDHSRPAERKDIAAFATTIEQTGASKGVFVSAAGFQSGAQDLARLKNIDTFTLTEMPDDWSAAVLATIRTPFLGVRNVRFRVRGTETWKRVPDAVCPYFLTHARLIGRNGGNVSVEQAMKPGIPSDWRERRGRWTAGTVLDGEWNIHFRGGPPIPADVLEVELETFAEPFTITATRPPEMRSSTIVFTNSQTNESQQFRENDLPFGFDTIMEAGRYYRDVQGREYYCEAVDSDILTLVLLASVQNGKVMWAQGQATKAQVRGRYTEITDSVSVERLRAAHDTWLDVKGKGLTVSYGFFADSEKSTIYIPPGFFDSPNRSTDRE
jgi:hypothetical protein